MSQDLGDLSNLSLLDLFRIEVETQAAVMTRGLLELERNPAATDHLAELMRGAHSLKGAAGIVKRDAAMRLAHVMEDCFVAAQHGKLVLRKKQINVLLKAVDLLTQSAQTPETNVDAWQTEHHSEIERVVGALSARTFGDEETQPEPTHGGGEDRPHHALVSEPDPAHSDTFTPAPPAAATRTPSSSRVLRVAPEHFNRLLGLSGETVVASRWLDAFAGDLLRVRRLQERLSQSLNQVGEFLAETHAEERLMERLDDVRTLAAKCRDALRDEIETFERFDRRFAGLSTRLYQGVLDCRMRPFADATRGFPRMVRDLAHTLGKRVSLEIIGESTPVDRDVLERMEAPLSHLLRNAVDHGIESPADRQKVGKPGEGKVRVEARHSSGMLFVSVIDDGQGLDLATLRDAVVKKKLAAPDVAEMLTQRELIEFLFLPGFTMKQNVTEISGRGVGLDVVQVMVREIGGSVRVSPTSGEGLRVEMRLPLTLSVLRALLVEIAGEPYAFPLARITNVTKVPKEKVESVEGREHFTLGRQQVGLVAGNQILGVDAPQQAADELSVIVLGHESELFGVVVDRFLGEEELVVRPLDHRLGRVKDISAAALLPNQSPVLIVDVDGMIRSIESLASADRLAHVRREAGVITTAVRKRILVVEDSLTVRELERKLLEGQGYHVEVAVDGMEGWNAVRTGNYDLVITDVDMPRLDGIELIRLIRKDPRMRTLPVMVVSYKDREEDRRRGLEAGADYYVAKGSFHHEALLRAVADLIGKAAI
jgi:two-component system, chemotaxis family, sensor histidine kinase and response regulator WspE